MTKKTTSSDLHSKIRILLSRVPLPKREERMMFLLQHPHLIDKKLGHFARRRGRRDLPHNKDFKTELRAHDLRNDLGTIRR